MKIYCIGDLIEKRFKERGITKSEFARRLGCSRGTVYNIFNRRSLDIDLLKTISVILEHDFISDVINEEVQNNDKIV